MSGQAVQVLAAPVFDPGSARVDVAMPTGLTLFEIVAAALPGHEAIPAERIRVALVTRGGAEIILPRYWRRVRPRAGVQVVIRVVPGKGGLRSLMMIVVSVAALAFGGPLGVQLAGTLGVSNALGTAIATAGINVVGSLLVNALIPPPQPDGEKRRDRYSISGWRNRYEPDGAIPVVMGTHRYAPPFAATSWTEIVGDWQYVRAIFNFGYGPLQLSDFRLGETSIAEYDEVEVEVRDGRAADAPISLYPHQIIEESISTELTRPMPRDDAGNITSDEQSASIETPVVRSTADDAKSVNIILAWPTGLVHMDDDGDKRTEKVDIRIEQRPAAGGAWQLVETLHVRARKTEPFFRQHGWTLPSRGRWQVRLTMMTKEPTSTSRTRKTIWVALQSIRPEYPLAVRDPLALVGLRIKATHQISGQLDDFSALARRVCLDYDVSTGTWIERATSNPASLYRHALQSPANPRPVADAGIDLQQLEDWHDFCRVKGLKYDRVLDDPAMTLRDVLTEIAAAGRASPRHDGVRWGVTIDRPQALVVDHITPRNSWNFRATRSYIRHPDAFRVKFADAGADYASAERLIRWPGHTGDIVLTEALELPGKTDAAEIWREARRRMYEAIYRPDAYEVMQDGPVRVATRGDRVALSQDLVTEVQRVAKVMAVQGDELILDEEVSISAGATYAIRFRRISEADTIGLSIVRQIAAEPGSTRILKLSGSGTDPQPGDLVMFGLAGSETLPAIVTGVEMGEDMSCLVRAVSAAEEIDATLDAEVPPAWSSRVGVELPASVLQPPEPRFVGVYSGASEAEQRGLVEINLVPGTGSVATARYRLRHRPAGASTWTTQEFSAADGGCDLTTYTTGSAIELQAAAVSSSGIEGPWTPLLPYAVGAGDAPIPTALASSGVTVSALLGGVRIDFATSDDVSVTAVQLYRSRTSTLARETDADGAPIPVQPGRRYTTISGDGTRENLLSNPGFASTDGWVLGPGWSIASGKASHVAGTAGNITQLIALTSGKYYRFAFTLSGVTGGVVTPGLSGGSPRSGTGVSTNGRHYDRLQAVSGQTGAAWTGNSAYAGSIDDVSFYLETAACLAQGTHYFWLEAVNRDGIPGPVAGPFSITID